MLQNETDISKRRPQLVVYIYDDKLIGQHKSDIEHLTEINHVVVLRVQRKWVGLELNHLAQCRQLEDAAYDG